MNIFAGARRAAFALVVVVGASGAISICSDFTDAMSEAPDYNPTAVYAREAQKPGSGLDVVKASSAGSVEEFLRNRRSEPALEGYATWIVAHADRKGTPEFENVAKAYTAMRAKTAPDVWPPGVLGDDGWRKLWAGDRSRRVHGATELAKNSVIEFAIGAAAFGIFVFVLGWVVRGFMGIPAGMDENPKG